ncbi:MAG: ABC transporter ATP-binding protein [Lentisphaerae bacterium]|jgi:putative ABC transport system ATP-binding protein|nr:ABC transporter ATP-binding protein [Lentisphaerota bacterium]
MSISEDIIVKASGVTKVYQLGAEAVHALRGIDLEVRRGEYLSILGPSGSGKSTFFNMVGGLDRPTEGNVEVDGYCLQELNQKQLAWVRCHKMGYIFQSFNLIQTMTALENVSLPRIFAGETPAQAREAAAEILTVVGLGHRLTHLPSQVSGGQQQRIAIARALVNRPSIILADEPTGNLDLKTGEEIIHLLGEMKEKFGITVITATHDMKMLSASDTVVWIKDGRADRIARKGEFEVSIGTIDGKTLA